MQSRSARRVGRSPRLSYPVRRGLCRSRRFGDRRLRGAV